MYANRNQLLALIQKSADEAIARTPGGLVVYGNDASPEELSPEVGLSKKTWGSPPAPSCDEQLDRRPSLTKRVVGSVGSLFTKKAEAPSAAPAGDETLSWASKVSTLLADDEALEEETRKMWRLFDSKGHAIAGADGLIDEDEANELVQAFCDDVGLPMPRKERFLELYHLTDKNESGKLGLDEFAVFFKRLLQAAANKLEEKEANGNGEALATQVRFLEAEGGERPVGSLVGLRVVVGGLKTRPNLNGKVGACADYLTDKGRYAVNLDGDNGPPMLLKPSNVAPLA